MITYLKAVRLFFCNLLIYVILTGCSSDEHKDYTHIPVSVDLEKVPYETLSEYHFFSSGDLKELKPSKELLNYKPNSELFTDYAKKMRFIWIPSNLKAEMISENEPLNAPIGSVLIKIFYYDEEQMQGERRILETRIMIRKQEGWIFANYIWNEAQTEAYYDMNGSTVPVSFRNKGETIDIEYSIPNSSHCITCHSVGEKNTPIGIKPIHLNYDYQNVNQLTQWIDKGFLINLNPAALNSVVDYSDTSKSLNERVRSYFDIQCASCHNESGSASYVPLSLDYHKSLNPDNMGVCIPASIPVAEGSRNYLVQPKNPEASTVYYLMNTNDPLIKMPRFGRTILHQEGVDLVEEWIQSLEISCQ